MSNISKIALSFFLTLIAFIVGRYLVLNLGVPGRWIIILGVIIFYIIWWARRRPPPQ